MELYNFFSEVIDFEDGALPERVKLLYEELKEKCHYVALVDFNPMDISWLKTGKHEPQVTIFGQVFGQDTNVGDTDILVAFASAGVKYYWFDALMPSINNLNK